MEYILIEDPIPRMSPDWVGFYKTQFANRSGRYFALCPHCNNNFERRADNLFNHKHKCPKKELWAAKPPINRPLHVQQPEIKGFVKKLKLDPEVLAIKFLTALISSSVPLSFANDPYLKDFLDYVGVQLPDRDQFQLRYLPLILKEVNNAQQQRIELAIYINVILDGWTDVSGIYYVAVVAEVVPD